MIDKREVIKRINRQIRICKGDNVDWITLSVETGKSILQYLDEEREVESDYENGFHDGYQQAEKDEKQRKPVIICQHCGRRVN